MNFGQIAIVVLSTVLMYVSYRFPRQMGWVGVALLLLLGSVWELTVIKDVTIPLRIPQLLAMIAFGIILSIRNQIRMYRYLLSSKYFIVWFLSFLLLLFLTGLQNSDVVFFKFYLLHIIPLYLSALIFGGVVVSDRTAFRKLAWLMVLVALAVGLVSIAEEAYDFSLVSILSRATNMPDRIPVLQVGGVLRPVGIEGDPIATGQKLVFFLPFIVYCLSETEWRQRLVGWSILTIALIGIFLARSRADIIAFGLGAVAFLGVGGRWRNKGALLLVVFGSLVVLHERLWEYMAPFLVARFEQAITPLLVGEDFQGRGAAIRAAWKLFADRPLVGNGAFTYVADNVLRGDDVPPVFLYLASGGVFVGGLLFVFVYKLLATPLEQVFKNSLDGDKKISIAVFLAVFVGLVPLAVNNTDKLFPVIIFLSSAYLSTFIRPVEAANYPDQRLLTHLASTA